MYTLCSLDLNAIIHSIANINCILMNNEIDCKTQVLRVHNIF